MSEDSQQTRCKYFNTGYCKYEERCLFKHPKSVCMLALCQDKLCQNRHPKPCRFKALCRRRTTCMYRHNKYEKLNYETEIDKLKEEIRQLVIHNNEKICLLKDIDNLKINNINLKQKLQETEDNLSVQEAEIAKLLDKVDLLTTEAKDNAMLVKKSLELFKIDKFKEERDKDIKMYILGMHQWSLKSLLEENIWCPDCSDDFKDIGELKKHNNRYQFTCYSCGNCLKEKENTSHHCSSEHVFEKTDLEKRLPRPPRPQSIHRIINFSNSSTQP